MILAADPGQKGGLLGLDDAGKIECFLTMPVRHNRIYDKEEINEDAIKEWLVALPKFPRFVLCERPTTYGMMAGSAFWYGFGFALLSRALESYAGQKRVHYVNPNEWAKEIHLGQDKELKAKAKSKIVFEGLFSWETFGKMNKASKEGLMDAALIAEFGRRNAARYDALSST